MNRPRTIALGITVLIAVMVFLWLWFTHIHISERVHEWPPRHDGEVAIADERFFDVIEIPTPLQSAEDPSPVHNDVSANNLSDPAPESGPDLVNRGLAGDAVKPVPSKQPSPVKVKEEEPKKAGPSQEELDARREEEARRKANAAMSSAFNRSSGSDNTSNAGKDSGDSGSPSGTATSINGTGTGSVGGGWFMPSYAKVPSSVTGSIRLMVKIDKDGHVSSVSFLGGDAPAATDTRLRQTVEAEVRSRRFTRGVSPAPDEATAYITYRFR